MNLLVIVSTVLLTVLIFCILSFAGRNIKTTDGLPGLLESITVFLLRRVGKNWSQAFYYAIARITAMSAILMVLLRNRNEKGEYANVALTSITQAGITVSKAPSGTEISIVLLAEAPLGVEPKVEGAWFDVSRLPNNIISHELNVCRIAVAEYCRRRNLMAVEVGIEK